MTGILVTGMSATGKSTALHHLSRRGHTVVDTDTDEWSHWVTDPSGAADWVWREDAVAALLTGHTSGTLFVAGCKSNQGTLYPLFDHVVLLSAPADVLLSRLATRTTNPYGRTAAERAEILENLATVEPLLRATCTAEIDTTAPIEDVVTRLELIAGAATR